MWCLLYFFLHYSRPRKGENCVPQRLTLILATGSSLQGTGEAMQPSPGARMCVCVCVCVCARVRTCSVTQSCSAPWNPMDCSLLSSSVHGRFLGKSTEVRCHALLQGIFLMQGSNPLLCVSCVGRWILYHCAGPLLIHG